MNDSEVSYEGHSLTCTNDLYYITPTVKLSIYNPNFLVTWSLNKNKTTYHVSFEFLIPHSVSAYSASESLLLGTTAAETKLFKGRSRTLLEIPDITPASQWNIATPQPNQDLAMPYQPAEQRKRSALGISTCSNVRWWLSAALGTILQCSSYNSLKWGRAATVLQCTAECSARWIVPRQERGRNYSFMIVTAKYSKQKKRKIPKTLREGSRKLLHYYLYLPPNTY